MYLSLDFNISCKIVIEIIEDNRIIDAQQIHAIRLYNTRQDLLHIHKIVNNT